MDERLLGRIWRAQRLDRSALRTVDGQTVEVVYRGQARRAPGPDFREAVLLVGGELRHGDVELHVRSSDWAAHGHGRDHHYDRVILHVVLRADPDCTARTARGAEVPCLPLDGQLGEPLDWAALARPDEEDCRRRIAGLDDAELGERLDRLGDARLRQKAAALDADLALADPEQVAHEALLEALGYSQNRRPGRELARRLPVDRLYSLAHRRPADERVAICQSLLFGVAGLLPSQRPPGAPLDWASAEQAEELEATWRAFGDEWAAEVMGADRWSFGVRPANSPPRRLAAMSHYLGAHLDRGLLPAVLGALAAPSGGIAARRLVDLLAVEAPGSYWAGYFDFGRPLGARSASLVGPNRALEVLVNVCLPLVLAVHADGAGRRPEFAWAAYRAAPKLAANEVTRWMVAEVLGPARAGVVCSARRQQGLHHLFRIGCDQRRCDDCPLVST